MLQLNPQIPVVVTCPNEDGIPLGNAQAIGWIDYGTEYSLIWIVAYQEGGEVWCVPNEYVRLLINATMGRTSAPLRPVRE